MQNLLFVTCLCTHIDSIACMSDILVCKNANYTKQSQYLHIIHIYCIFASTNIRPWAIL